jgi:hypothetical protein
MTNNKAHEFYLSTMNFCNTVENFNSNIESDKYKTLLISLLDMYSKAFFLPDVEPQNDKEANIEISLPNINFNKYDCYWEVFNPYHLEEPLMANLSDDILDIYKDVKRGIYLYNNNEHKEAISEWKINFEIHWGNHAVDAIRALHSVILN